MVQCDSIFAKALQKPAIDQNSDQDAYLLSQFDHEEGGVCSDDPENPDELEPE